MVNLDFLSFSNLTIYDYHTALEILSQHAFISPKNEKIAIFVAGPNGSGKSTLIANLYKQQRVDLPYINADIMALKMKDENIYSVMGKTIDLVKEYITCGYGFIYETVFSDLNKLELAQMAKEAGYQLICIAVTTSSPDINISRVAKRVTQGGHDVPTEKIILRYAKSIKNIDTLRQMSNKYLHLDNSKDR